MKKDKNTNTVWICKDDTKTIKSIKALKYNLYQNRSINKYKRFHVPDSLVSNVKRICKTISEDMKNNKKILLWGDYDVDGTSSVLVWIYTFRYLNYTNFTYYIPDRKDGYGLSIPGLEIYAKGHDTIITMDNGITAYKEAQWCKKNNIKLIVTDHHTFTKENRTKAPYIFHPLDYEPNYYSNLCGSSISHLISRRFLGDSPMVKATAFLASMGVIGDIVPLDGYNREVFHLGQEALFKINIPCFEVLKKRLKFTRSNILTADDYGFTINPLINACGRMSTMKEAIDLFTSKREETDRYLRNVIELNMLRKEEQKEQTDMALRFLETLQDVIKLRKGDTEQHYVLLGNISFKPGLIGLIAGKIAEHKKKNTMVYRLYKTKNSDMICEGSGRSYNNQKFLSILREIEPLFINLGGHEQAFGFSFYEKDLPLIEHHLDKNIKMDTETKNTIYYDSDIDIAFLSLTIAKELQKHEPFGEGFPHPVYRIFGSIYDLKVTTTKTGKHTFIHVLDDKNHICKVNFYFKDLSKDFKVEDKVEILLSIGSSVFINKEQLSLKGIDIKPLG